MNKCILTCAAMLVFSGGLVMAQVPATVGEVPSSMLKAQRESGLVNVKGTFSIVERDLFSKDPDEAKRLKADELANSLRGATLAGQEEIKKLHERRWTRILESGMDEAVDVYEGIVQQDGRFAVEVHRPPDQRSRQPIDRRYVFDGNKVLIYEMGVGTALIQPADAPRALPARSHVSHVLRWMNRPNYLHPLSTQVTVTGEGTFDGKKTLVVKDAGDLSLYGQVTVQEVVPEWGYVTVSFKAFDPTTNTLTMSLDAERVTEIAPKVWRPLKLTESQFLNGRLHGQRVLSFDKLQGVNAALDPHVFEVKVPVMANDVINAIEAADPDAPAREAARVAAEKEQMSVAGRGIESVTEAMGTNVVEGNAASRAGGRLYSIVVAVLVLGAIAGVTFYKRRSALP